MKIKRKKLEPLQLFKIKAAIVKKFGKEALLLFNKLSQPTDIEEIEKIPYGKSFIEFLKENEVVDFIEIEEKQSKQEEKRSVDEEEIEETNEEELLIKPIEEEEQKEDEEETSKEKEETENEEEIEEKAEESSEEEEISPSQTEEKEPLQPQNEMEEEIYNKFGEEGLKILRLIDGKRTIAEIAIDADTTIDKVINVVKYLESKKKLSLKKKEEEQKDAYSPLTSDIKELESIKLIDKTKAINKIKKINKNFITESKLRLVFSLKFGKIGRKLFDSLKEGKDVVELSTENLCPLSITEEIISICEKEHYIKKEPLTREEVRKKYGEDGYIIYKKYGKKGVLFYELLGKDVSMKKIKELVEVDVDTFIEILSFIRKTLGITIPIDKELIIKKLTQQ